MEVVMESLAVNVSPDYIYNGPCILFWQTNEHYYFTITLVKIVLLVILNVVIFYSTPLVVHVFMYLLDA